MHSASSPLSTFPAAGGPTPVLSRLAFGAQLPLCRYERLLLGVRRMKVNDRVFVGSQHAEDNRQREWKT